MALKIDGVVEDEVTEEFFAGVFPASNCETGLDERVSGALRIGPSVSSKGVVVVGGEGANDDDDEDDAAGAETDVDVNVEGNAVGGILDEVLKMLLTLPAPTILPDAELEDDDDFFIEKVPEGDPGGTTISTGME